MLLSLASKIGSLEIMKIKMNLNKFYFNKRVSFLKASFIILSSLFLNVSCVSNLLYPLAHLTCSGIDIYFVRFFLLPTHFAIMPHRALCQLTVCVALYLGYMSRRHNKQQQRVGHKSATLYVRENDSFYKSSVTFS